MTSLDAQCQSTFQFVANSVVDRAHWKFFGHKRCPLMGSLFLRFVRAPKLERYMTLSRELWAASFGVILCWALEVRQFSHRGAFIAKLMEYSIDGLKEPEETTCDKRPLDSA